MSHAQRVAEYNAQLKRMAGSKFNVIEVATGKAIGAGPYAYGFAKYVADVRNLPGRAPLFVLEQI